MKHILPVVLSLLATLSLAQSPVRLASPDGRLVFSLRLTAAAPVYRVAFGGKPLVDDSPLSLLFAENGPFGPNLTMGKPQTRTVDESYELLVGKAKTVRNHCREAVIPLLEKAGTRRQVNLAVRVYNDGVAFRYEFPQQAGWTSFTLLDEQTTFRLAGNPTAHTLFRPNFLTSHEGFYDTLPLNAIKADTLMDLPTLFDYGDKTCVAITEAALSNYAGMYLVKKDGNLMSRLSPLPTEKNGAVVKATLPHRSPWRVLMIGERIGALIESNILANLNEPSKIRDVSWIRPGKTMFPWWNGNVLPDTSFAPGNNFETAKYYIDFCAENQIEYHSVVEYGGHEWYVSDGINFQPGPHTDAAKPVPGLDMQAICDYGKQRGVGIRVWVHWQALYGRLDTVFAQYEKWGLAGLMCDFMDRDDQEMVNWQELVLQKAAEHKLHVQFHGAYKPTGMHRTYPNEFTREGTLNYENMKWNDIVTPDHDVNVSFTRMLAGATDYHLGGFRAAPRSKFKVQHTRPLMLGTRCHQLAMHVVLESYLGMVCDYPDAYRGQPGFDFLKQVPTVWDETRVPAAQIGQYLTIARRKAGDWYVGSLNNGTARTISVNLTFLPEGRYEATLYTDAPDVDQQPNHLVQQTRTVSRTDVLSLQLAAGGGHVMRLRKL
ncbi:MAG: glycoside hydrolase family 97 protein [Bacteroidetes bacterium]|nr:glycoside hydrolase family 97 protein [Fibrella sp.]